MGEAKQYIFNQSDKDKTKANILITEDIGKWWGDIGLRQLADQITASGATDVMIQICSDGGDVFQGHAMASFIEGFPANIETCVLGLCASAATFPAMAGKKTYIAKGSRFMIHNASTGVWGESKDHREAADLLDNLDGGLVSRYVDTIARNGKLINDSREETRVQVKEWMVNTTYFSAEDAVKHGFIQELTDGVEFLNKANSQAIYNSCNRYKNVPVAFLNKVKSIADNLDIKNGASLGSFLNGIIGDMETEELSRGSIIDQMATAAGISTDTVGSILNGSINCPPLARLEGFAEVLDTTLESIIEAAEKDSCEYVLDTTKNKKMKNEAPTDKGLIETILAYIGVAPKAKAPAPVAGQTHEQKLEAAKALVLANGLTVAPVAKVETPVTEDTENEALKAQLATAQAEKKAAELKAQKLQEEKDGAPSGSKPTMHTATEEKPLTDEQNIENLLAANQTQWDDLAAVINQA